MTEKIRIGVSSCLLGNEVRYNGGHARDRYITDTLGAYFDFVPVCPKVECGFGVPRETMRLEGAIDAPRLMTTGTRGDHTDRILDWAHHRVRKLEKEKRMLTPDEKQEVREVIDSYHKALVPIIVPLTLINHYVRKYDEPYLKKQVCLNPHPVVLKLRNHV